MSISIRRYVDITSGVGGGAAVAQRELIGRIFSDNPKTPADAVVELTSAQDAADYYGSASEEYKRAAFYFAFTSKSVTRPKKLSFARWAKVTSPARIYGAKVGTTLAAFHAIVAGDITLTVNGQIATVVGLDLSAAGSLAAVAAAVQVAIRAEAGSEFAAALVAYDAVGGEFNFTATTAGAAAISIEDSPLVEALGWLPTQGAVLSPGVDVSTITDALDASVAASNNFGSFTFIETLVEAETVEASTWVAARNVEFMYLPRVTVATAAAISADILGLSGSGMVLGTVAGEYDELLPMMVLAATDYERRGAVQNYMFQQTNLSPKVSTNADADTYDALRVNYYGNTQTAGQQINFFQRGVLTGVATDPVDMNTFANEMWFKDAAAAAIMSLLLALPRVPANAEGRSQVLAILQDPINRALLNGTISVSKPLTVAQQIFIGEITGDPLAWHQVQTLGYWVDAVVVPFTTIDNRTEYKVVYTLVYSKDDTVRKVEGTHALI
jgi:hypothetical protein